APGRNVSVTSRPACLSPYRRTGAGRYGSFLLSGHIRRKHRQLSRGFFHMMASRNAGSNVQKATRWRGNHTEPDILYNKNQLVMEKDRAPVTPCGASLDLFGH